jgi:hypothetical protein
MPDIKNLDKYTAAMQNTLLDKIWFLDKVDPSITTIIDFGCADGSLFLFIESLFPDKFTFIGIDSSDKMLDRARLATQEIPVERIQFHTSLDTVISKHFDNSILVLNSILHELYNYLPYPERTNTLKQLFSKYKFKYIAIRDMHKIDEGTFTGYPKYRLKDPTLQKRKDQFDALEYFAKTDVNSLIEFLLKYNYIDNWDRECHERYLWNWSKDILNFANDRYSLLYDAPFYLPYQLEKWTADCEYSNKTIINTHRKMLFRRNQEQQNKK